MSAAIVSFLTNAVRQLDAPSQPVEDATPQDVQDPSRLSRVLKRLLLDVAALRRRFTRNSITFTDIVSTGTSGSPQRITLTHGMGGVVEWTVVRLYNRGTIALPLVVEVTNDNRILVLDVYYAATIAIRVESTG